MAIEGVRKFFSNGFAHVGPWAYSGLEAYSRISNHPVVEVMSIGAQTYFYSCAIRIIYSAVSCRSTGTPPQNPVRYSDEEWNQNLHIQAVAGNEGACRVLIKNNADPNALDSDGNNSLRIAANYQQLEVCKILLDNGANWTDSDRKLIQKYLKDRKVDFFSRRVFFRPFPNPGILEIWNGKKFQLLSQIPFDQRPARTSRIAFMYVLKEKINEEYGTIARCFNGELDPLYRDIAEHFPLLRASVESRDDMVFSAREVAKLQCSIGVLMFEAHGDSQGIAATKMDLQATDEVFPRIMAELTETPSSANLDVIVHSCEIAQGEEHFVQKLSRVIPGSVVYGSSKAITDMVATFYRQPSGIVRILPFFCRPSIFLAEKDTRSYRNGSEIVRGDFSDGDVFIEKPVTNFRHFQAVAIVVSMLVATALL